MIRPTIPRAEVETFLQSLGLEPEQVRDVTSVSIDADRITVRQHRRDADGHLFAAGDFVASVETEIGIQR